MTAVISRAVVVGGHDGRAEIQVEITYDNGGTSTISLDEEACTASLDRAHVGSIDDLVGQPWSVVLPALRHDTTSITSTSTSTSTGTPSHLGTHQGVTPCSISSSATD